MTAAGLLREVFGMFSHGLGMSVSALTSKANVSMAQLLSRGVYLSCAVASSERVKDGKIVLVPWVLE